MAAAGKDLLSRLGFVLLLSCALVGCGSESSSSAESGAADTSRFEMVITRTDKRGRFVMSGVADYQRQVGAVTSEVIGAENDTEHYNGLAIPGDEVRIFGETSYAQWTVKDDRTYWVEDTGEAGVFPTESIVPFAVPRLNPRQAAALILDAATPLENRGREEVRGASTTHYRAQIDPTKLGRLLPAGTQLILEEPRLTEPFHVDVWIDDDHRTRRIRVREAMTEGDSVTTTHEFYDFGVEVDVERPPSDELITEERLDELTRPSEGASSPEEVCAAARENLSKKEADRMCLGMKEKG